MTLREAHMKAFEADSLRRFRQRLFSHLLSLAPEPKPSLPVLEQQVDAGLKAADEFGFTRECDVARFIEIVLLKFGGFLGPSLPKRALNVLYAYRVDPADKLEQLALLANK
jgi:hypothetical protein